MSLLLPRKTDDSAVSLQWTSPDAGLWVANRGGEYAGMIEFIEGHFVARDSVGRVLETFADIPLAQAAIAERATKRPSMIDAASSAYKALAQKTFADSLTAAKATRLARNYRRAA